MMTITVAQERFVEVAYPRALKSSPQGIQILARKEATRLNPGMPGEAVA